MTDFQRTSSPENGFIKDKQPALHQTVFLSFWAKAYQRFFWSFSKSPEEQKFTNGMPLEDGRCGNSTNFSYALYLQGPFLVGWLWLCYERALNTRAILTETLCECIVARGVAMKLTATSALHTSATKSSSIRLLWNRSIEVPPHKASSPQSNKGILLLLFYFLNLLAPSLFSLQGAPLCLLSSKLRWSLVQPTAPPLFLRALPKHPNRWNPSLSKLLLLFDSSRLLRCQTLRATQPRKTQETRRNSNHSGYFQCWSRIQGERLVRIRVSKIPDQSGMTLVWYQLNTSTRW